MDCLGGTSGDVSCGVDQGAHFEFDGAQVLGDVFGVWFEGGFSGRVLLFYADRGLCTGDVVCVELAEEGEDLQVGEECGAGVDDLHGVRQG